MSICIKNIGLIEKQLFKNYQLRAVAYYSRRNNSKNSEAPYKYVRGNKLRVEGRLFFIPCARKTKSRLIKGLCDCIIKSLFACYLNFSFLSPKIEEHEHIEGGANWELLAPKSNRFFLPNLSGPAFQSNSSTISAQSDCLAELVDFTCKDPNKLHISSTQCPVLLKKSLVELFPAPEVRSLENFF